MERVISDIFQGQMPTSLFGGKGQYLAGLGIDPDVPMSDDANDTKTAGIIRPVNYTKFSSGNITAAPIAILTNPKDSKIWTFLADGNVVSYHNDLSNELVEFTLSAAAARGAWYYNNYFYVTTPSDVARIGPLDSSPSLDNNFWTGTLGKASLNDTSFPTTLFGLGYLNHFGISHIDGAAYFLDYLDGIGYVHFIETQNGANEGSDDSSVRPSSYGFLDLPVNYIPISISSYGNDLVVSAAYSTDGLTFQGPGALFFFNPADTVPSFYRKLPLPDVLCTVLMYVNGTLYGISGDLAGGHRLFRYVGGDNIQTLATVEDGVPPLQAAGSSVGDRIVWAANTKYPMVTSGIWAYGSKSDLLPRGLHNIAVSGFTAEA